MHEGYPSIRPGAGRKSEGTVDSVAPTRAGESLSAAHSPPSGVALIITAAPTAPPELIELLEQLEMAWDLAPDHAEPNRQPTAPEPALLILDLHAYDAAALPGVIQRCREMVPGRRIVGVYRQPIISAIVAAMRAGLDDCFGLREEDRRDAVLTLRRLLSLTVPSDRVSSPTGDPDPVFECFVTAEPAMKRQLQAIAAAARTDEPILLRGPTGSGKNLLASLIHRASCRKAGPFVEVSCAALAPTLLESELFGHERGSFTGAAGRTIGKVEAAEGGTLFFDEIDALTPPLQAKLLRLLQNRTYERVGSTRTLTADVRFLAATNADLQDLMRIGGFRPDLYYRIAVVCFVLPPLAERPADIERLATAFLRRYSARMGKEIHGFESAALRQMRRYAWPGNVREVENVVKNAVIFSNGRWITLRDLPPEIAAAQHRFLTWGRGLKERLEQVERETILQELRKHNNCRTSVAAALGISRVALYNKIRKLGLLRPDA